MFLSYLTPAFRNSLVLVFSLRVSQCAARRTRHRAFYFGGGRQVGELKNKPKRNPKTIAENVMADKWANAKSNQESMKKLRKIIKSRVWDHPGALGRSLGTSWAPGRPRARKEHQKAAKFYSVFSTKMETGSNFSWFFFVVFFEMFALQIFHDFGCPRSSFWLPFWLYFESSGPLGKQLKVL